MTFERFHFFFKESVLFYSAAQCIFMDNQPEYKWYFI